MQIKNTTFLIIAAIIIIAIGGFIFISSGKTNSNSITGNAINNNNEIQKITLSIKNYNYYPNTIKVKANQPVEITLDNTVTGCLRSFTIPDFGISKNSKSPDDKIVFTPAKTGSFRFACSMGMGYGTLIVE